jgi:hypothetical protein
MEARVSKRQAETLISEIELYLAAVDSFRAAGCEPRWRLELGSPRAAAAKRAPVRSQRRRGSSQTRKET